MICICITLPLTKEIRSTQRVTKCRREAAMITESSYKSDLIEQQRTKGKKLQKGKEFSRKIGRDYDKENKKRSSFKATFLL